MDDVLWSLPIQQDACDVRHDPARIRRGVKRTGAQGAALYTPSKAPRERLSPQSGI
jgi:hypothetical protein